MQNKKHRNLFIFFIELSKYLYHENLIHSINVHYTTLHMYDFFLLFIQKYQHHPN